MGAVLTPQFAGLEANRDLPNASTFCGRCSEVCPVGIPIPNLLRKWREQEFSRGLRSSSERVGLRCWSHISKRPRVYRAVQKLCSMVLRILAKGNGYLKHLPLAGSGWTRYRDFPAPARKSFQAAWAEQKRRRNI
jgi:L-lactate dehydrogenase complex protein LldF